MNAQLQRNRDAIDQIDQQVVELLNKRVLHDGGADEDTVLAKIPQFNNGPLTDTAIQSIYRALMVAGLDSKAILVAVDITDSIDEKIVCLLNQRVQHAAEIGKIKFSNGADYYDPTREAQVMEKIASLNSGPITISTLQSVYREVISASIALEKRLVIAYLGPESTFTHQAAIRNFGVSLEYQASKTIPDVFTEVENGHADYGVVPIENSTEGAVFHTMDMLVDSDLHICSQVYLPIEHCLISRSGVAEIDEVHSKDQALGQCRQWLHTHLPNAEWVDVLSTADAVRSAKKSLGIAAVASELSAQHYGVPVKVRGIQDREDNVTRFLVVGKTQVRPYGGGRDKSSLVISLKDEVGALERTLRAFATRGINLSKIESRPSRKKAWDYYFFIDLVGHYEDENVQSALSDLKDYCPFVKWLGSYPEVGRV
jgi:chorismate mutase/prephenate dehydratase